MLLPPISTSVHLVLSIVFLSGCATTLPQHPVTSEWPGEGHSAHTGLAFGRFLPDENAPGFVGMSTRNLAEIELRNEVTGDRYHHSLHKSGRFYWELPGGHYEITQIWMGFRSLTFETDSGPRFHVVPGKIIYLGTLAFHSPLGGQMGGLDILNDYLIENQHLYARYQAFMTNEPPLEGLMYVLPPKEMGETSLDIIVKNNLMKPFLLDTITPLTARN